MHKYCIIFNIQTSNFWSNEMPTTLMSWQTFCLSGGLRFNSVMHTVPGLKLIFCPTTIKEMNASCVCILTDFGTNENISFQFLFVWYFSTVCLSQFCFHGNVLGLEFFMNEIHAIPFYKKHSYKKRPIKFFNHKKQWPIEFSNIRNDLSY